MHYGSYDARTDNFGDARAVPKPDHDGQPDGDGQPGSYYNTDAVDCAFASGHSEPDCDRCRLPHRQL